MTHIPASEILGTRVGYRGAKSRPRTPRVMEHRKRRRPHESHRVTPTIRKNRQIDHPARVRPDFFEGDCRVATGRDVLRDLLHVAWDRNN